MNIVLADEKREAMRETRNMIASIRLDIGEIRQAASGGETLRMLAPGKMDVVVMEAVFSDMDGICLIKKIRKIQPGVKIIVYSQKQDFNFAVQALRCRVSDYLLKPTREREMEQALRKAGAELEREKEKERKVPLPSEQPGRESQGSGQTETVSQSPMGETAILVEKAKRYIGEHYGDPGLSVERLSGHLHVSRNYFSTIFKKETGETYVTYLTRLRLEKAGELLRNTENKNCVIAQAVGYTDPNYFSYLFKKNFGVAPSVYGACRRRAAAV